MYRRINQVVRGDGFLQIYHFRNQRPHPNAHHNLKIQNWRFTQCRDTHKYLRNEAGRSDRLCFCLCYTRILSGSSFLRSEPVIHKTKNHQYQYRS